MSWSERLRLTFDTFKRTAFPLYIMYILFYLAIGILCFAAVFSYIASNPHLLNIFENFSHNYPLTPNTGFPQMSTEPVFPFNPSDPFNSLTPQDLSAIFHLIWFLVLLGILLFFCSCMLQAGTFNLAVKGIKEKAFFRDITFKGTGRIILWQLLLSLLILAFFLAEAVVLGILSVLGVGSTAMTVLGAAIFLSFLAGLIFLYPWFFSGSYYLLANMQVPFSRAFKNSFGFFRQNMGTLWLGVLTILLISIVLGIIPRIGGFLTLIATPFIALVPIVWTLSLLSGYSAPEEAPVPASEPAISSDPVSTPDEFFSAPQPVGATYPLEPGKNNYAVCLINSAVRKATDPLRNYCDMCGTEMRTDSVYCPGCGVKRR